MRGILFITILLFGLGFPGSASAHEMRPAYLEIRETTPGNYDVLWKVPARGETERLSLQVRFADDVEEVTEPVGGVVGEAHVQRWRIQREGGLAGTPIEIAGLSSTFTDVLARVELIDIDPQAVLLKPQNPSFVVAEIPSRWEVASTYLQLGVEHILLGVDHLLFVLGLLILVDRRWMLVKTITSFTIAHSITLALSTFAIIKVPEAPLNAAIALSILFLGPEIVRQWRGETSFTIRHPWIVAFLFGLLHGIGFASGLSLTGVPRPEIPNALLFFNLGVELGQLGFVAVVLALLWSFRRLEIRWPRYAQRLPGYTVGTLGGFWTIQRTLMLFG